MKKPFVLMIVAAVSFLSSISHANDIADAYSDLTKAGVRGTLIVPLSPFYSTATIIDHYDKEIILQAKDDAMYFIATEGEVKGASLEQALMVIREVNPEATFTDMQLVEYILSVQ